MNNKHIFAIYIPSVEEIIRGSHCCIDAPLVYHRLVHVLRCAPGSEITLFDAHKQCLVRIASVEKKRIVCDVLSRVESMPLSPSVTVLLPLLKRQNLKDALSLAVQMGASAIQLCTTHKSERTWHAGDQQKLEAVIQAACEQAKQFCVPTLHEPCSLGECIKRSALVPVKLMCDPDGASARSILCIADAATDYLVTVGPEGGFTQEEVALFIRSGYTTMRLTPTILEAKEAAGFAVGLIRCLVTD